MLELDRTVSSVGNEYAAKVGYEFRFLSRYRHVRRAAFPDIQVVGGGMLAAGVTSIGKSA